MRRRRLLWRAAPLLTVLLALATQIPMPAHASGMTFQYRVGYSVQHGWLCYGARGVWHCTQHWATHNGRYVSLNPTWVPSEGSFSASSGSVSSALHTVSAVQTSATSATPLGIAQWAYTGRASYPEPYGIFQGFAWGWCTSGAAWLAHDSLRGLGNAVDWAVNARARGMPVTSVPTVGATVVFQPGIQGASPGGHVAHVIAVYANGWFLVEETNFYWNGGGFGRVSFRYAHAGQGVSFIL